jgi:hypothetical protein
MKICCGILVRKGTVSDKSCRKNKKINLYSANPFLENRAAYEIMWKKYGKPGRPRMTLQQGTCALHAR